MRKESVRTPRNESKKMAAKVNPISGSTSMLKWFSRLKINRRLLFDSVV